MTGFHMTSGRGRALPLLLFAVFLVLLTAAVSLVLREATKDSPSDSGLSSYALTLEASNSGELKADYSFTQSCIFSESGSLCMPKTTTAAVYPGLFSSISLSSDVKPGRYHGVRVQIAGAHGRSLRVKSAILDGRKIFDGRDASAFRNVKGMRVVPDRAAGLAVLQIESDAASFDLDCAFSVEGVKASAIKYTGAVMAAVIFLAVILLLSVLGAASAGRRKARAHRSSALALAGRLTLTVIIFCLLLVSVLTGGQLFLFNEYSVSAGSGSEERLMIEVSDSPDFSYAVGRTSLYSTGETRIRIPARFPSVRISLPSAEPGSGSISAAGRGGSCAIRDGVLRADGSISCAADREGRLYIDAGGLRSTLSDTMPALGAALAVLGVMFLAMRLLGFGPAVRLLLVAAMLAAYVTGELCMNVESGNVVFYRSYLQLLPDVTLRNISLILIIFLLSELSFSHGFMRSGTFLEVLLLVIVYIAIDWGVFQNFGVRPDIRTMLSHTGAGGGTFMEFLASFFRTSHASWMVLVMLAVWIIMLFSVRLRKDRSLRKYLLLAVLLNCIPFLKVYENFYAESSFQLRKDIFDIQGSSLRKESAHYTKAFPQYGWKPAFEDIEGLGRRKNVVLLLVESLADVYSEHFSGLKGYTPEIDAIAKRGASFLNYHSTGMETAPATYSIMTGRIFFQTLDRSSRDLGFEYGEALPRVMRSAGYRTSAIYSSEDFGGRVGIYKKSGFERLYDTDDPAYEGEKRYIFNSVADGVLLRHASDLIREFDRSGKPHFTFILTTSTHAPFENPETGKRGYREVIPYTDREVGAFVRRLEKDGFFENGTLFILGDHRPPIRGFEPGEIGRYGEDLNRVPLIILDRDIGKGTYSNVFGHDSLKAIIEYLNLTKVRKYEYQLIPFLPEDAERGVTVLCPMIYQSSFAGGIRVSAPDGRHGVYDAKGDGSEFTTRFLTEDEEAEVAGRVKWMKREE